jgi:outer membrane protein OmpA-like peptidoglycan-associated protein
MNRTGDDWNDVDFNAPAVTYDEVSDKNINVRGNNNYGIYGVGENILFDEGKSTLRSGAEANLRQIVGSIDKRYSGSNVRVYGYTDAVGSAGYNKELAEQRAEAVRNWLVQNGNVAENRISVHPVGEGQPVASNSTEQGRQQNRRVEIVARGAGSGTGAGQ